MIISPTRELAMQIFDVCKRVVNTPQSDHLEAML